MTGSAAAPRIFVTPAMLDRARDRVAHGAEPFRSAARLTLAVADDALTRAHFAYQGPEYLRYFTTALYEGSAGGFQTIAYESGGGQAHAARHLALAYHLTGSERYLHQARAILVDWALAQELNRAQGTYPAWEEPHAAGLVIGRVVTAFADVYCMLFDRLEPAERTAVEAWFADMAEPIRASAEIWRSGSIPGFRPPYLNRQYFNNHLGAHVMGLLAIGLATQDEALVGYALNGADNERSLERMIAGAILRSAGEVYEADPTKTAGAPPPEPGELFDRYRTLTGEGLAYALLSLRFLVLAAEMASVNDHPVDYFRYETGDGRGLAQALRFYAPFLVTGDSGGRTGYYAGDAVDWSGVALYDVAARHYPDDPEIAAVPRARPEPIEDRQTFGWTSILTHRSG